MATPQQSSPLHLVRRIVSSKNVANRWRRSTFIQRVFQSCNPVQCRRSYRCDQWFVLRRWDDRTIVPAHDYRQKRKKMGYSDRTSRLQCGPRYTYIYQSYILNIISGAFMAGSTNIGEFIFFRFVAGASAFMILGAIPVSGSNICRVLAH